MLIFTFLIILLQCQYIQTFTLSRISTHNFIESDTSLNAYAGRSGGGGGGRGGGGSYGGRGGGGGGRGGGGWRGGSRQSDSIPIRFAKTIKIDPSFQTPLAEIGVSDKTRQVLTDKGFELMTPIQSQSYDLVYSGVDVVARSRTGTGKTFAFGLPLIEKVLSLDESLRRRGTLPLILVLEPTRELALQVAQELQSVCSAHRLTVEAMFGGSSFFAQEKALRQGVHILVSTPGRILDHITRGTVDLSGVQHVVLDEGDMMLEMGFQKDVETILSNVKVPGEKSRKAAQQVLERDSNDRGRSFSNNDDDDDLNGLFDDADSEGDDFQSFAAKEKRREPVKEGRDVQMLLFSATMPGWICKLTDKHMVEPVFLDAVQEGETRLAASLKHFSLRLPQGGSRVESIQSIAEDLILTRGAGGQTIVFTNTKEEADSLFGSECFGSMRCQVLHGDISQNTRQATIKQFRDGQIEVLIATDVAARGLDIAGVDLVLHTAPPNDHDTYVHRSGRTGRAGRNGTSICLFSGSEESKLRTFESQLNFKFERVGPPTVKDISEASALIVSRKLSQVNKNVVKYMIPHAKQIVANLQDSMGILADPVDPDAADFVQEEDEDGNPIAAPVPETEVNTMSLTEKYELLVAKCLAAMSNRKSMVSRSLQTGESGMTTLQVEAVFKNGTSPDNVRDWQRLFSGVLKRSFDMEEVRFGRVAIGRTESRAPCALVDVPNDTAEAILEAIEETKLPAGLGIKQCETLPHLVPDFSNAVGRRDSGGSGRSYVPSSRFGSGGGDRSYSGGGGDRSYSSGGGERSYSSGGSRPYSSGGGGDRSYSSGGDRPVTNGRVWTREGGAGTSAPSRDNESGGERRTFTSSRTFAPR